ncbi:MAG: cytochrome c [Deltaproteobacteria bacterium]|nr:cytochrome c [Deltaproteobacteria bacterium]
MRQAVSDGEESGDFERGAASEAEPRARASRGATKEVIMRPCVPFLLVFLSGSAALAAAPGPDPKALYGKLCASCHGADGRGNPVKAKSLKIDPAKLNLGRPEVEKLSREEQRKILLKGKEKMPAYEKKLKPDQVDPVLDYALGLGAAIRAKK